MATPDQPVAETATSTPAVDVSAYEQQIQALKNRASEAEDKFQGIKGLSIGLGLQAFFCVDRLVFCRHHQACP